MIEIEDWGLIDYELAVQRQLSLVDKVADGSGLRGVLVFCTHPPIVTLGRSTTSEDVLGWQGTTYASSRGGRATYHGPSQIVVYPILSLNEPPGRVPKRDIHGYLRLLESATVEGLRKLGVQNAEARTTTARPGEPSLTGVWVGEHKMASIGIAVRKWVTYHGVAVNILDDPNAFSGIRPCGFSSGVMTSVERELGSKLDMASAIAVFKTVFNQKFSQ